METKGQKTSLESTGSEGSRCCSECHHLQDDGSEHFPDCRYFILSDDIDDDDILIIAHRFSSQSSHLPDSRSYAFQPGGRYGASPGS